MSLLRNATMSTTYESVVSKRSSITSDQGMVNNINLSYRDANDTILFKENSVTPTGRIDWTQVTASTLVGKDITTTPKSRSGYAALTMSDMLGTVS